MEVDVPQVPLLASPGSRSVPQRTYRYEQLVKATQAFSLCSRVADSSSGAIYRGHLDGVPVAIKCLGLPQQPQAAARGAAAGGIGTTCTRSGGRGEGAEIGPTVGAEDFLERLGGVRRFKRAAQALAAAHHPHLLMLLGSCPERAALVMELAEGGSLHGRLLSVRPQQQQPLAWQDRVRICFEAGAALNHLHSSEPPIVHGAVGPRRILLDGYLRAKLAVGLEAVLPSDAAQLLRPELPFEFTDPDTGSCSSSSSSSSSSRSDTSRPSDIYQLGVTMLQAITGREDAGPPSALAVASSSSSGCKAFAALLDVSAGPWPMEAALQFARLGLRCMAVRRDERPSLGEEVLPQLLQMLTAASAQAQPTAALASSAAQTPATAANDAPRTGVMTRAASLRLQQQQLHAQAQAQPHAQQAAQPDCQQERRQRVSDEGPGGSGGMGECWVNDLFLCPITQEIMADPVVAADGNTYERAAIQEWLKAHVTSPMTNLRLPSDLLVPNLAIKSAIKEWRLRSKKHCLPRPAARRCSPTNSGESSTSKVNNLASSMEWESGAGPGAGSDAAGHPSGTEAVVPARTPVPQHEMQRMQDCELRSACSQGNASLAGQLLARGAAVNSADVRSGHSALHCAAQHGSVAVVHLLLDNGAQVDAVARDGVTTPLLLAVVGGHTAVVRALLWRGARAAGAAPNAWGPLHAAAACNRLGIMEMLLQLGASAGVVDARSGQLPEDAARRRGHARAAELLSAFRAATA